MSTLALKADKEQTCWHVRFVPKADISGTGDNIRSMSRASSTPRWRWLPTRPVWPQAL